MVEQTPSLHVPEQKLLQAPQWLRSTRLKTHTPPQQICELAQGVGQDAFGSFPAQPAAASASTSQEARASGLVDMAIPSGTTALAYPGQRARQRIPIAAAKERTPTRA
ncbi:MAG: hypothetical protein M5U28_08910 [Sandaracinaceae bacterium]|nr:hypothetical protein [Sandaracinaceae bacterium]